MYIDGLSLGVPMLEFQNLGDEVSLSADQVLPESEEVVVDSAPFVEILSGYSPEKSQKVETSGAIEKLPTQEYSDPKEDPSVKENLLDRLDISKGQGTGKKQKAMLKFMDSMESELGIPPQRIVEAMAMLNQQDQLRPPEETLSQVIENLNLEPQQKTVAKELYSQMLGEVKEAEPLPVRQGMVSSAIYQANERQRKQMLGESIDRLNDRFFVNSRFDQRMKVVEDLESKLPKSSKEISDVNKYRDISDLPSAQEPTKVPLELSGLPAATAESITDAAVAQEVPHSQQLSTKKQHATESANSNKSSAAEVQPLDMAMAVISVPDASISAARVEDFAQVAALPSLTATTDTNIQEIISQAKYVAKEGGGEAIVKLHPEGLGPVHLKVLLKEGKLNLEMQAETKEAKRLIESSIHELRMNLADQQINVENVQVEVGLNSNNERNMDFRDQSRESARQFLGQFHEQNMRGRDNFFEMESLRAYNKAKGPPPLSSAPVQGAFSQRYAGRGRGGILNLVA